MRRQAAVLAALALLLALGACSKTRAPTGPGPIVALSTDVPGLSGLTRDPAGVLWAVGERGDFLLEIHPTSFRVTPYPVAGAPKGADLEALASTGPGSFVIGTETQEPGRTTDALLLASIDQGRLKIRAKESLDYRSWGLEAPKNHGIEGLCYVDGIVVMATELVDEQRGRRWAPVALLDLDTKTWRLHRVALTSDTGKLSALDCRRIGGEIVALGVERHFGVARLIRFEVPTSSTGAWLEPRVVADLAARIDPLPNFEGLSWADDGSVVLLTDNRYAGSIREPSTLYFIPASALQ